MARDYPTELQRTEAPCKASVERGIRYGAFTSTEGRDARQPRSRGCAGARGRGTVWKRVAPRPKEPDHRQPNSRGTLSACRQVLFCIVTGSAPLAAMMFNDPLSGYGIGHLGAGGVLALDDRLHPLLGRLRRDGAPRDDGRRDLLVHVVRLRPHHRPRRRDRHRGRLHPLRRRRQRRHVLLRPDEHPRICPAASTWTGASTRSASSR